MKLLNFDNVEITELDFGNVEISKSKTLVCFLENNSEAELLDIKLKVANEEVTVTNESQTLKAFAKMKVTFVWTPSLKERKGLKTDVSVEATEIWK
jgi:hypothetical protein